MALPPPQPPPALAAASEARARQRIDALLAAAGWQLQHRAEFNRQAAEGVAVRGFPLACGPCDYRLLVAGLACGVIEAKPEGVTLSGVAEQSGRYLQRLPEHVGCRGEWLAKPRSTA